MKSKYVRSNCWSGWKLSKKFSRKGVWWMETCGHHEAQNMRHRLLQSSFFSPYYTQIHWTAFFPFSPIHSQGLMYLYDLILLMRSHLTVTFGLHHICRYIRLHRFSFLFPPHTEAHVQYDLVALSCMIWSLGSLVCDMILHLIHVQYNLLVLSCTISISEPPLLRYLVLGGFRSLST